ncbi:MAG: AraC family transcriptional regulator [Eubacteriales bacterium]|nr:AraC family transcriptional regulator [Eubacteriales bacterium]
MEDDHIQMISYLQNHYRTATLASTAEHFNYNVSYCSRLIKEMTGSTFVELLREIRLKQAEAFLRTAPISIEKLSYKVGYENPETFIRAFKKSRGITPTQYRNSQM